MGNAQLPRHLDRLARDHLEHSGLVGLLGGQAEVFASQQIECHRCVYPVAGNSGQGQGLTRIQRERATADDAVLSTDLTRLHRQVAQCGLQHDVGTNGLRMGFAHIQRSGGPNIHGTRSGHHIGQSQLRAPRQVAVCDLDIAAAGHHLAQLGQIGAEPGDACGRLQTGRAAHQRHIASTHHSQVDLTGQAGDLPSAGSHVDVKRQGRHQVLLGAGGGDATQIAAPGLHLAQSQIACCCHRNRPIMGGQPLERHIARADKAQRHRTRRLGVADSPGSDAAIHGRHIKLDQIDAGQAAEHQTLGGDGLTVGHILRQLAHRSACERDL